MRNKVFVVGLDGGTLDLLGPWMAQGILPNLRALAEHGVSGALESTIPPMTAPAWTSFMTGNNPGKHAIYDFGVQEKTSYRYRPINARFRSGACLWDRIGQGGGRVVVLNVPTTYPPHPVNGALIGDFLTPSGKRDFVYPPELLDELEARFGTYPLYPFPPYFVASRADADIDRFIGDYAEAMIRQFAIGRYLIAKLAPHFFMLHIYGNDQICHWLWHLLDATHAQYHRPVAEKHLPKLLEYYRRFDTELGKLAELRDADTALFIMSDHGFGPLHKVINLNVWLLQEGYLVLKRQALTKLRYLLWTLGLTPEGLAAQPWVQSTLGRLVMRKLKEPNAETLMRFHAWGELLLSLNDVDWSRTKAFCLFGWGQIKINVKGRYPQGCVGPGAEYHALRSELVQKLRELKDPDTGEPVGGEVFTADAVYHGPFVEDAPDITFLPMKKRYWANSRGTGFLSNRVFSAYLWGMTGMHSRQGILVAQGKPLRQGTRVQGVRLIDLFPSILYLLGLKVPQEIDGQVLRQLFSDEFLQENAVEVAESPEPVRGEQHATFDEQEDEVVERLRGLGYL